jgi:HEAT repeat protein
MTESADALPEDAPPEDALPEDALPEQQWRDRLPQLTSQLRSKALNERIAALNQLATCPSAIAVSVLQDLAHESEFLLRRIAVMGLGNHRTEASFQALAKILTGDKDGNVVAEAANSIFEFGDRAIPLLQERFNEGDWLVRQTILSLLIETEYYAELLAMAKIGMADPAQSVKEAAVLALRTVLQSDLRDEAIALIKSAATSPNWRDRMRAATALQGCDAAEAKTLLALLQTDEHYRVVSAALEAANN